MSIKNIIKIVMGLIIIGLLAFGLILDMQIEVQPSYNITCPPPEVTCYPSDVIVTPEITVEPSILVESECPDCTCHCEQSETIEQRYTESQVKLVITSHIKYSGYALSAQYIERIVPIYATNGIWEIRVKFKLPPNRIVWDNLIFDEVTGEVL